MITDESPTIGEWWEPDFKEIYPNIQFYSLV